MTLPSTGITLAQLEPWQRAQLERRQLSSRSVVTATGADGDEGDAYTRDEHEASCSTEYKNVGHQSGGSVGQTKTDAGYNRQAVSARPQRRAQTGKYIYIYIIYIHYPPVSARPQELRPVNIYIYIYMYIHVYINI